jgi:hypothetical protein
MEANCYVKLVVCRDHINFADWIESEKRSEWVNFVMIFEKFITHLKANNLSIG